MNRFVPHLATLVILLGLVYGLLSAYTSGSSDLVDAYVMLTGAIFIVAITLSESLKRARSVKTKKAHITKASVYLILVFIAYAYFALAQQYLLLKTVIAFFVLLPTLLNVFKALEFFVQIDA